MGRFLDSLDREHPWYRLEETNDGIAVIRRDGREHDFNRLARELIDNAGAEFVALPTSDGHTGYERVFLIPI